MDLANYLSFLGAAILLTLAPGPDNMYILTKSLSAGPRQGVTLAMGLATGPLWHTLLVMVGVAAFIQSSPAAFMVLKYCGAAQRVLRSRRATWWISRKVLHSTRGASS